MQQSKADGQLNPFGEVDQILQGGFCVGCGACTACGSDYVKMRLNPHGQFEAYLLDDTPESVATKLLDVCPFSNHGPNEDEISEKQFPYGIPASYVGRHLELLAGHVTAGEFRSKASSGGIISWVVSKLIDGGHVDSVLHVRPSPPQDRELLFRFNESNSVEEIMHGAKSKYYPVEMSEVLRVVASSPGKRFALVGIPCFIKAVRRLCATDSMYQERIVHTIGLVCGHLKSKGFADSYGWQMGITPGKLESIDFRVKLPGRASHSYGVRVQGEGINETMPNDAFLSANWGFGFFKYQSCEFCDDVFSETADISVGDAWLPKYSSDPDGNSIVVIRSKFMQSLIATGRERNEISVTACSLDDIKQSQAGGIRHKRDGLALRLSEWSGRGLWHPKKRVQPNNHSTSRSRKRIYRLREKLRTASHAYWLEALATGRYETFLNPMQRLVRDYRNTELGVARRILRFARTIMLKMRA